MLISIGGTVVVAESSLQFDNTMRLSTYRVEDSELGDTGGTYAEQYQSS